MSTNDQLRAQQEQQNRERAHQAERLRIFSEELRLFEKAAQRLARWGFGNPTWYGARPTDDELVELALQLRATADLVVEGVKAVRREERAEEVRKLRATQETYNPLTGKVEP